MKIDMQKAMRVDMWKAIGVDMPLDRVLGSWEKLARGVNETLRASPATPAALRCFDFTVLWIDCRKTLKRGEY